MESYKDGGRRERKGLARWVEHNGLIVFLNTYHLFQARAEEVCRQIAHDYEERLAAVSDTFISVAMFSITTCTIQMKLFLLASAVI